jgi:acetyltransferase-like isoleucine patch superfamily enzyme
MNGTAQEVEFWAHPKAIVESKAIGSGTRIWAFTHVADGAIVGRDCNLGEHVYVENGASIGDNVTIKNGVHVWEGVTLQNDVFVGPNAVFTNDRSPRSPRSAVAQVRYRSKEWLERTLVREGASIGANATILCGIEIGRYASVGAGAVVTRSVPPFTLVVGAPAVPVGTVCACGRRLGEAESCCPVCSLARGASC